MAKNNEHPGGTSSASLHSTLIVKPAMNKSPLVMEVDSQISPGIYVFHTWSFCAGRKTPTIGLFELFIIIIGWIFCAYTQILSRNVEDFCIHA